MKLTRFIVSTLALAAITITAAGVAFCQEAPAEEQENRGYLQRPPVYLRDDRAIPIATFGVFVPRPGTTTLCTSAAAPESSQFVADGVDVQPYLKVTSMNLRAGLLHGFSKGWAAGFLVPWSWQRVQSGIGNLPATGNANGPGGVMLFGKKMLWQGKNDAVSASVGFELPTGKDDATFNQSNASTNAYYQNYPQRMPLSWQPSNGAYNSSFILAYLRTAGPLSYEGIMAYKVHGAGDEDVKLGNIFMASATATLGLTERVALACDLVFRSQGNDSYPNAPGLGVNQPSLAGTTTHGTELFLDPSVRWKISRSYTVGVGLTQLLIKPDNGMIPRSKWFVFLYPNF